MRVRAKKGAELWFGNISTRNTQASLLSESKNINEDIRINIEDGRVIWVSEDKKAFVGYDLNNQYYFSQTIENEKNIIEFENES